MADKLATIYVVDDQEFIRSLLVARLRMLGVTENDFDIQQFNRVDKAKAEYSKRPDYNSGRPALILSDNSTPPSEDTGSNWGYVLAQTEKGDSRPYFALIASMGGTDGDLATGFETADRSGKFAYLEKPINTDKLSRFVSGALMSRTSWADIPQV